MNTVKSITEQELEGTKIRLIWANKEQTRLRVILWAYKYQKHYTLIRAFEEYMKALDRDRLSVYYRDEEAAALWQEFFGAYSIYEEAHPDMTWAEYLENAEPIKPTNQ
jgi:murein L,D-transpeptidase YafK